MRPTLRLLATELHTILHSPRGVVLAVVLPAVLVLLVGQLRVRPQSFRILVAGAAHTSGSDRAAIDAVLEVLRTSSRFAVSEDSMPVDIPLRVLQDRGFDAVLNVGDAGTDGWTLYTAETRAVRLAGLEDLAAHLGAILRASTDRPAAADRDVESDFVAHDAVRAYFPRAGDRSLGVVAITLSLIICFLPFLLAAPALIRDREERTLEMALVAPGVRWWTVLVAKTGASVVVGVFTLLLLMTVNQLAYDVYLKPGTAALLGLAGTAMIASAALGLAVSALATTQSQVTIASGLYFLAMIVFTGLLIPLSEASSTIVALAHLLPATFVYPAVQAWMVGGGTGSVTAADVAWLGGQMLVYGAATVYVFSRTVRNL